MIRSDGQTEALTDGDLIFTAGTSLQIYNLVSTCIEAVFTKDEEFRMTDYTTEERTEFFESLTQTHFLQLQEFFDTMPYIYYTLKYVCEHCKHKEEIDIRGIQNFFT